MFTRKFIASVDDINELNVVISECSMILQNRGLERKNNFVYVCYIALFVKEWVIFSELSRCRNVNKRRDQVISNEVL